MTITSVDVSDYLAGANAVIKNGTYVEEMNAYVMYVCDDKYVVVGMSSDQSYITTYHVKSAAKLAKKAPSLFGGS